MTARAKDARSYCLAVTEANHTDNQFYLLGGAGWRTEAERAANLATIPEFEHECDADDRCYMLDILGEDGFTIEDDREISAETAMALLGVDNLDAVRTNAKRTNDLLQEVAL